MTEIKPTEIRQALDSSDYTLFDDASYAKPTRHWLREEFSKYYRGILDAFGESAWRAQWDCDDFSSLYRVCAQICHSRTGKRQEQGIAVGEVQYTRDAGGKHAINCAFTEDGLIFIEPQTCLEITLSPDERYSICFVRF